MSLRLIGLAYVTALGYCSIKFVLKLTRSRSCRCRNIGQLSEEAFHCVNAIIYCGDLCVAERNVLPEVHEVRLALQQLRPRGLLGPIEGALCTSHPVWALVEEIVRAVAVSEIVELPWLVRRSPAPHHLLIDEHFNRTQVPFEVPSIGIGLCQFRWRDLCVVLRGCGRGMAKPVLQFE
jgi:hypothetical protein